MNFKIKAVVAAVALAASFGAQANVQAIVSGNTSIGSSVVVTLLDSGTENSAAFDLGIDFFQLESLLESGSNASFDLTSAQYGSVFADFLAAATGTVTYDIYAGLSDGNTGRNIITATTDFSPVGTTNINTNVFNNVNRAYYNALNASGEFTSDDGALFAEAGSANNAYTQVADSYNGQVEYYGALGSELYIWEVSYGAGRSGSVSNNVFQYVGQNGLGIAYTATLSENGSLVVAVPEPETYAMLLAGLGLVAMAARRRRA